MKEQYFNEEEVRRFYRFFNHKNSTEIRVFDEIKYPQGKTTWVQTVDEFVEKCRFYCESENVSVYIGARDRNGKGDKNVTSSNFIFFEIDEHGINKDSEKEKLINFLKGKGIRISMQGMSGGGWHFYVGVEPKEFKNSEEAMNYKEMALGGFKKILLENGFDIDAAVFNLERVTRVLGTYNFKRKKLSKIDFIEEEDILKSNSNALNKLLNDYEPSRPIKKIDISDDPFITSVKKNWTEGNRQELAMSLAGYLRKEKKLGLNSSLAIIKDIARGCNDEEINQRLSAVRSTYDKDESEIKGYAGLIEQGVQVNPLIIQREINWCGGLNTWAEAKLHTKNSLTKDGEDFLLMAHSKDEITGKPQLIHNSLKTITLMKKTLKEVKDKDPIYKIKFIDDNFDKRYDGTIINQWSKDFFVYRVNSRRKDYFILSKGELPLGTCKIKGMVIPLSDFTEMNKTMKIRGLSNIFLMKDYEPVVKILGSEKLIEKVKDLDLNEDSWFEFLGQHPLGTTNCFPKDTNLVRSAFLLSGKLDGWPLHLGVIGPAGTRKSMGYIETIADKFSEDPQIIEGGNSRIKGLSPSFKEKPANIGYLAKCERMGWVDELGKMIEAMDMMHEGKVSNVLGELNFLLDHKRRTVGSGNDNECIVQANSKFMFVSNPVKGRKNIYEHVGIIDPTTMSRIFWWVQNVEEQKFVISNLGIKRKTSKSPGHPNNPTLLNQAKMDEGVGGYAMCPGEWGGIIIRDDFLTIFDSCNSFVCNFDLVKVDLLSPKITDLIREPMRSVWGPRASHQTGLLLDGLTKHRCLFKDFNPDFVSTEEDYQLTEKILRQMVSNWNTDLSIKIKDYQTFNKGLIT